jgi:diacylglycerol O-acyltransferase / wax synthase
MTMSRQRLGNADAAWLHMDRPTNLMVVNSVMLFDEPLSLGQLAEIYSSRLIGRYPRFSQRVEDSFLPLQGPSWVDDPNFDLDRHLHHIGLQPPGDIAALQEVVGDLIATPLDRSKPLWDIYLIDGLDSGCAILTRMHHCIADGIALARVMLTLTDTTATAEDAGPGFSEEASHGSPITDALTLASGLAHEGVETLLHPRRAAGAIGREAQTLAKLLFAPNDSDSAVRGQLSGMRRVAWSEPIPLDQIKAISHAQKATVNDVLLAAVSGALRSYMLDHDGPVVELHAIVPFNLRPLDKPIPRSLGNKFGLVFLALPVDVASPRDRLRELKRGMDEIKSSHEGPLVYAILGAVGLTPPQVEKRIVDLFSSKGTAVMTNVPGPREPVYFAGVPVRSVLVWAPTSGSVGMSVSIFSYRGEVTIGLMVDAALVPEPQQIIDALGPELDEQRALNTPGTRRRARRAGVRAALPA